MNSCAGCQTQFVANSGTWWQLKNYYGITGRFCPGCYDLVSHDSYGQPNKPEEYTLMLLKISGEPA